MGKIKIHLGLFVVSLLQIINVKEVLNKNIAVDNLRLYINIFLKNSIRLLIGMSNLYWTIQLKPARAIINPKQVRYTTTLASFTAKNHHHYQHQIR